MVSNGSEAGARPLIGLSTYVEQARFGPWDERAALVPFSYVAAVTRAGGAAVLLPPTGAASTEALEVVDGLVLTGGPDLGPGLYGAQPHPLTDAPRHERDAWEVALCRAALEVGLPLLAICRGLQILNVARGGSLHQHLPEVAGHDGHRLAPGQMSTNHVQLVPGSTVAEVLGATTEGMCHHHQAIDRLGDGLLPAGYAGDGTVEAVEMPGHPFAVAVQWHPEDNEADDRLFAALVQAATRGRAAKLAPASGPSRAGAHL